MKIINKVICFMIILSVVISTLLFGSFSANAEENDYIPAHVENEILITVHEDNLGQANAAAVISTAVNSALSDYSGATAVIEDSLPMTDDETLYMLSATAGNNSELDILDICDTINASSNIIVAEPNYLFSTYDSFIDIDPIIDETMTSTTNENKKWYFDSAEVNKAWEYADYQGDDVVVAVMDTGCYYQHSDLSNRVVSFSEYENTVRRGYNASGVGNLYDVTDNHGHGTAVASVIAGESNNAGAKGISYNAKILPIKVSNTGTIPMSNILFGISMIKHYNNYVADMDENSPPPVSIVNMSFSLKYDKGYNPSDPELISLKLMLEDLSNDCILVAAAGNATMGTTTHAAFPAAFPFVIGAMSYDSDEKMSYFSNYNTNNESYNTFYNITAPGSNIYTASITGTSDCRFVSGTSFSSPFVAGALALYISNLSNPVLSTVKTDLLNNLWKTVAKYNNSQNGTYYKISVLDLLNLTVLNSQGMYSEVEEDWISWTYNNNNHTISFYGYPDIDDCFLGGEDAPWDRFRNAYSTCSFSDDIETIGNNCFYGSKMLSTINYGENVYQIGEFAFAKCEKLTSVIIPSSITTIKQSAFWGCKNVASISLPATLQSIGSFVFEDCSSLTSAALPQGWTSIPSGLFKNCTSLSSVSIPNTVRIMSGNIFAGCTSLTSITLPSSLERITGSTFKNTRLVNVVMPVSTTNIGIYVFNDIPTLQSITIYDNVTTIHENAFNNTSNLTFRVLANSYALQYAQNHNINYEIIT